MNTVTIYVELGDEYGERNTLTFTGENGNTESPIRQALDYIRQHERTLAPGQYIKIARDLSDDPAHFAAASPPEAADQVKA